MSADPLPVSRREVILLFALLPAVAFGHLVVSGALSLLDRHLWLDEVYTHALVADASLGHMLRALADGVEGHPPTYYLLLRAFTSPSGTGNVALRLFSLGAVLVALAGLYLTLRRSFDWFVCACAVAVVGCHPLALNYAVEARHYALWLAATAWLAWALGRRSSLLVALVSVLVCTTHYFGVISLVLVATGAELTRPRGGKFPTCREEDGKLETCRHGVLAGVVALAACVPLLLAQRRAYSVPTWVPKPDARTLGTFLRSIVPLPYLVLSLAALMVLLSEYRRGRRPTDAALVGLGALALMPVALIAFSYLLQPVLIDRYAFPTLLAFGPLAAVVFARLPRWFAVVGIVVLGSLSSRWLYERAGHDRARDVVVTELIDALRSHTEGPVVFARPHELYMICHAAPDLADRCFLLDIEPGQEGRTPRHVVFMRDLARRYAAHYENPGVVTPAEFHGLSRRFFVPFVLDGEGPPSFPRLTAHPVAAGVFEYRDAP